MYYEPTLEEAIQRLSDECLRDLMSGVRKRRDSTAGVAAKDESQVWGRWLFELYQEGQRRRTAGSLLDFPPGDEEPPAAIVE